MKYILVKCDLQKVLYTNMVLLAQMYTFYFIKTIIIINKLFFAIFSH